MRHSPLLAENLNHRQVALLSHAMKHPGHGYTMESHRRSHRVAYQTARSDLLTLVALNHLEQRKRGRAFHFIAPSDLRRRIEAEASQGRGNK